MRKFEITITNDDGTVFFRYIRVLDETVIYHDKQEAGYRQFSFRDVEKESLE